jgi:hypothetical protein
VRDGPWRLRYAFAPMACERCFQASPTTYVEMHYNVGMLFMRQEYVTSGELCRSCVHRVFADHTLRNLTLGWWGMISFFMTWYFLISNTAQYFGALSALGESGPRRTGQGPSPTVATGPEAAARLMPFEHNVRLRLRKGEGADDVAHDLAATHDVTLDDARSFVDRVQRAG